LPQVANVGSVKAAQNFVQRASDAIGASHVLTTAPSSVATSLDLFSEANIGGLLSGDIFGGDSSAISAQISLNLSGTESASTNAGQTSASQRDDEDEVAEVDEAAFQNLKNYD
jgi:hypothetical protein